MSKSVGPKEYSRTMERLKEQFPRLDWRKGSGMRMLGYWPGSGVFGPWVLEANMALSGPEWALYLSHSSKAEGAGGRYVEFRVQISDFCELDHAIEQARVFVRTLAVGFAKGSKSALEAASAEGDDEPA